MKGNLPCCPGLEPNQAGACSPKDPPGCGVTTLGRAPACCKNKAPCTGVGTCVVDKTVTPPYWYCTYPPTGNPPSPAPNPIQTGGGSCVLQSCLVYCFGLTNNSCDFGGAFCSDALAANAWNTRLGTTTCHACCGLADCQNGSDFSSDLVCAGELDEVMNPP